MSDIKGLSKKVENFHKNVEKSKKNFYKNGEKGIAKVIKYSKGAIRPSKTQSKKFKNSYKSV